jgi:formylglycine-generating enzyme
VWVLVAAIAAGVALYAWLAPPRPRLPRELRPLHDLTAWREAPDEERLRAALEAVRVTPGFTFLRMERFDGGDVDFEIALARHERSGLEFSLVPAGVLRPARLGPWGARGARAVRRERIALMWPIFMARTETTVAAYRHVLRQDPPDEATGRLPVDRLSWDDARAWCIEAGVRLPRAMEWEWSCRGGSEAQWPHTNDGHEVYRYAWFRRSLWDTRIDPEPVATKAPNAFGLFDMLGNVAEWGVEGFQYDPSFPPDSTGNVYTTYRMLHGGDIQLDPWYKTPSSGGFSLPTAPTEGFRVCVSVGGDPGYSEPIIH